MFYHVKKDLQFIVDSDPAARNKIELFLLYPSIHAMIMYRMSHFFYTKKRFFIARLISQVSRFFTQIEIHPGAQIGDGILIDHGSGVVIGETAELGDRITIYHGTTLGGVVVDSGNFDWIGSGKFPCLTEPDMSYNGLNYAKDVGAAAYATKLKVQWLRDSGACLSPFNAFMLLQGLETMSLRIERHIRKEKHLKESIGKEINIKLFWLQRYGFLGGIPYSCIDFA